jgi:hypothetical protein
LRCEVCKAPALPVHAACAFCRSPLAADPESDGLLEYLSARLPTAHTSRGFLGRPPLREVRVAAAGTEYRARLHGETLDLRPHGSPAEWVDRLLGDLSRDAATDAGLRSAMARAGWAFR